VVYSPNAGKHVLRWRSCWIAQKVDHICFAMASYDVVGDATSHLLEDSRHQSAGATKCHFCAELEQRPDVRAGHPAVKNISRMVTFEARNFAFVFQNREGVQEG